MICLQDKQILPFGPGKILVESHEPKKAPSHFVIQEMISSPHVGNGGMVLYYTIYAYYIVHPIEQQPHHQFHSRKRLPILVLQAI